MRDEISQYQSFLEEFAAYGYAKLFLKTGDFYQAQAALEEVFIRGFEIYSRTPHLPDQKKLILRILDGYKPIVAGNGRELVPDTSFSKSPKLQAVQEARTLLRTFSDQEQMALVLLYVEELPEAKVKNLLELENGLIPDLRARIHGKVAGWEPPTPVGEEAADFFERALRQYRLSSHFVPTVVSRIRVKSVAGGALARGLGWTLFVIVPTLLLLAWVMDGWDRYSYGYGDLDEMMWYGGLVSTTALIFGAFFVVAALLIRRFLVHHAPVELAKGPARSLITPLRGLAFVGVPLILTQICVMFNPDLLRHEGGDTAWWYGLFYTGWRVAILVTTMVAAYIVAVHYMRRLDRQQPKRRSA